MSTSKGIAKYMLQTLMERRSKFDFMLQIRAREAKSSTNQKDREEMMAAFKVLMDIAREHYGEPWPPEGTVK